jgi:NADPH:quinone reductase-like Zn-dependent oxidoreductase
MVLFRMKAVQFSQFGVPPEVAGPVELPAPPAPGPGEIAVDLLCSPINPADLLLILGHYGTRPPLPAFGGLEGVGRVSAIGPDVTNVKVGDRVLIGGGCWRERMITSAHGKFPLPAAAPAEQLAMLTVNPPTAWGLLHDHVKLEPGDWVLQNAANSGVGTNLIVLARRLGLRSIAVVRRDDVAPRLRDLGADLVLVDGPDLPERVRAAIGGDRLRLAIDAVAGEATLRLAACLDDSGVVVNYGLLSGQPCQLGGREVVFRDIRLEGFWLNRWFGRHSPAEIAEVFGNLAALLADGTIAVPVEATYPLSRAREALEHAAREGRGGKVLLVPDPR